MKKIALIYTDEAAAVQAGNLGLARLVPALQAAGVGVEVHRLGQDRKAVLDALAVGALPIVVKPKQEA